MNPSLEITNIKNEPTDQLEIPYEIQLNSVKQESVFLVQSVIYIKTEPQEGEMEFPVIASTSHEIFSSDVTKYDTNEPMLKIKCKDQIDEIIKDPLEICSKIKVEEYCPIDLDDEPRIKTEPTEGEKCENLLEINMTDSHGSCSNQDQDQLLNRNNSNCKEKKYECYVCSRTFTLKGNLDKHLRIHIGVKPFTCDICKKSFNVKRILDTHMLIHSGEKPYVCDVCKKAFRDLSGLNKHKLIHSGVKHFSCNVCNKLFTYKQDLARHKRRHTGEKPFACDFCTKAFTDNSSFIRHRRLHTGEKPYSCNFCNKSFVQNSDLNKHKRIHKN